MLTILACGDGASFASAEPSALQALLKREGALIWVDIEQPSQADARVLLDVLHFHPLTVEDCLDHHLDPPKVDDYSDYLFIVMQSLVLSEATAAVTASNLNIYLGTSYLVTVHDRPIAGLAQVVERCKRAAPGLAHGADWLMHAVLDAMVDELLPALMQIDERISLLEDEALARPKPELIGRMTALKRSILRLHRSIAPQRDVVNRLSRGDYPQLVRPETFMYYRDVYDHLMRLEEIVNTLRDLGDSVIATYLATINNRMNEVMKALSIVGTIFLPLTLLASVFGTNFAPTYADWGWPGFAAMCAVMLVSIIGSLWLFRRSGWL